MAKTPGFAVIAIVTMALVVGATTAVFSVAEAFSFVPLRYLEPPSDCA
jgi:putative ABC transport system permease protein